MLDELLQQLRLAAGVVRGSFKTASLDKFDENLRAVNVTIEVEYDEKQKPFWGRKALERFISKKKCLDSFVQRIINSARRLWPTGKLVVGYGAATFSSTRRGCHHVPTTSLRRHVRVFVKSRGHGFIDLDEWYTSKLCGWHQISLRLPKRLVPSGAWPQTVRVLTLNRDVNSAILMQETAMMLHRTGQRPLALRRPASAVAVAGGEAAGVAAVAAVIQAHVEADEESRKKKRRKMNEACWKYFGLFLIHI